MLRKLLLSLGLFGGVAQAAAVAAPAPGKASLATGRVTPKSDVLAGAFVTGFVGRADDKRYSLRTVPLGTVHLPSGRLTTLDPFTFAAGDVASLALSVAPGRYPVDLAVADTGASGIRVALARIIFSDAPVGEWRIAHTSAEDPSTLRGDAIFGYGVDSGTGSFADPATVAAMQTALMESGEYEGSQHERWVDAGEAHAAALGIPHGFALNAKVGPGDVAMFASGWGDGVYASWVGYDSAGRPVQVVTDFAVIEAVNLPKPQVPEPSLRSPPPAAAASARST